MRYTLSLLTILMFSLNLNSQTVFKDYKDYSKWIMNYYKNPDPINLYDNFKYGLENEEIAKAGNGEAVIFFFAAIFRHDTTIQNGFFIKFHNEKKQSLRYGFIFSLWNANTDHSTELLKKYKELKVNKKDVNNIDSLLKLKPINILNDSIKDPSQLDMLWADFFASGNKENIIKITTALENIDSDDKYYKLISSSARWSLKSMAYMDKNIYKIITDSTVDATETVKDELKLIISEVDKIGKK